MRNKFFILISLFITIFTLSSCGGRQTLLFLNWGEYIDEELIEKFEEKENCTVLMDLGESNEIFYSKLKAGTTVYDVICPSDYMVIKMYQNNLLEKLDFSKFDTYNPESENIRLGVKSIFNDMKERSNDDIINYFVPYLWGTWGIMYETYSKELENKILTNENEWSCLFDRSSIPTGTKVAMYDSHQHAYYAACRYLGYSISDELPQSNLDKIKSLVSTMKYNAWGTDSIKKDIVAGNIDLGFMWTGDFLYYYAERIADIVNEALEEGEFEKGNEVEGMINMINTLTSDGRIYKGKNKEYQIGFDLYIPSDTIAFCDNLVISKDAQNKELAYKFINFMTSYEIDEETPAYDNTYYVCYDTPYIDVYKELLALEDEDTFDTDNYYDAIYDYAIGISFRKYYPLNTKKGNILATFDRQYIKQINTTFNNART